MTVEFTNLTIHKLREMTHRETVTNVPDGYTESITLTKTQIGTLILIQKHSTSAFAQIRDYNAWTLSDGTYIPSQTVVKTLRDKGVVSYTRLKQVSRRTGRTSSGFEKKAEGGYISVYSGVIEALADQLGYDSRWSDELEQLGLEIMQTHPSAD